MASLALAACGGPAPVDPAMLEDASTQQISRVEPLCWWTGMKTDLQLMVQGPDISACEVSIVGQGLKVTGVHKADSPDYLFVDVEVGPSARPGEYYLVFTRNGESFKYSYQLRERRKGSAGRETSL